MNIILKLLSNLSLFFFILISCAHAYFGDNLLFLSDIYSLISYLSSISLFLTLICAAPILISIVIIDRLSYKIYNNLLFLTLLSILTFMISICLYLFSQINIDIIKDIIDKRNIIFLLSLLLSSVVVYFTIDHNNVRKNVEEICLIYFIIICLFVPTSIGYNYAKNYYLKNKSNQNRHLVLMVFDGLPSQYINTFNPLANKTILDKIFNKGRIYKNFHTSVPYTNAYFGILYSGDLKVANNIGISTSALKDDNDNLISILQEEGIYTQWISYHRNGIPEGSASRTNTYMGLRSYFLTNNTSWYPELLGIKYHITLADKKFEERYIYGKLGKYIYSIMNHHENENYIDDPNTFLLNQIKLNQKKSNKTFTIFHIVWHSFTGSEKYKYNFPDVQNNNNNGLSNNNRPNNYMFLQSNHISLFKKNNWRYPSNFEPVVSELRNKIEMAMLDFAHNFNDFINKLNNMGNISNATLIFTSDHGYTMKEGRIWYRYHPNEEVLKVPVVILNSKNKGFDERLFSTVDLTESIFDFFSIKTKLSLNYNSIFDHKNEHKFTISITDNSKKFNEWYIILYNNYGEKYLFNLNPNNKSITKLISISNFDEKIVYEKNDIPLELKEIIKQGIIDFGIPKEKINKKFHDILN